MASRIFIHRLTVVSNGNIHYRANFYSTSSSQNLDHVLLEVMCPHFKKHTTDFQSVLLELAGPNVTQNLIFKKIPGLAEMQIFGTRWDRLSQELWGQGPENCINKARWYRAHERTDPGLRVKVLSDYSRGVRDLPPPSLIFQFKAVGRPLKQEEFQKTVQDVDSSSRDHHKGHHKNAFRCFFQIPFAPQTSTCSCPLSAQKMFRWFFHLCEL